MAALLIIPILSLIVFHSVLTEKNIDINIRSNELEYFADSIERDLNRFMEITGKRSLIAAVSNITVTGKGLDDASLRLGELISNGTLYGTGAPLVDADNLNTWRQKISDIASNSGFNIDFKSIKINVNQNSSFDVKFETTIFLNISDSDLKMGVARNITASVLVNINGLEDPIFPLKTLGRVVRIIRPFNFTNYTKDLVQGSIAVGSISGNATFSASSPSDQKIFITSNMSQPIGTLNQFGGIVSESTYVPEGLAKPYMAGATGVLSTIKENERIYLDAQTKKTWDLQNLTLDIKYGYYTPSNEGASFLDRLEGNLTLSNKYKYGLETFVNLEEIKAANLPVNYQLSCVDYEYWKNVGGVSVRNGNYDNVFNRFKIDSNHAIIYGVDKLI
jgi:hypothetical protein